MVVPTLILLYIRFGDACLICGLFSYGFGLSLNYCKFDWL